MSTNKTLFSSLQTQIVGWYSLSFFVEALEELPKVLTVSLENSRFNVLQSFWIPFLVYYDYKIGSPQSLRYWGHVATKFRSHTERHVSWCVSTHVLLAKPYVWNDHCSELWELFPCRLAGYGPDEAVNFDFLLVEKSLFDIILGAPTLAAMSTNMDFGSQVVRLTIGSEEDVLLVEPDIKSTERKRVEDEEVGTPVRISRLARTPVRSHRSRWRKNWSCISAKLNRPDQTEILPAKK